MEQAETRVDIEDEVEVSPYYKTLYYGLRKNHEHNAATVYPILFVLRRVIYSLVIVFLINDMQPFFGALILIMTTLFMLIFVAIEGQWESKTLNTQELINEFIFYVLCISLLCFAGVISDTR